MLQLGERAVKIPAPRQVHYVIPIEYLMNTINTLYILYEYCIERDINVRGLMCIPPNDQNAVKYFDELNLLKENLNKNLFLSMGMSSDYQTALKSGSNMVRIGSRIFE